MSQQPPSVSEAKQRLLEFGQEQDEHWRAMYTDVRRTVRSVAPWVAGSALGLGLFAGKFGRRRKQKDGHGERRSGRSRDWLGPALRWGATTAAPLVADFLKKSRAKRATAAPEGRNPPHPEADPE